jgi:hypothetical protein
MLLNYKEEFETTLRKMYTNLKEFQDLSTLLLTLLDKVNDKKVLVYGVQLTID